MDLRKLCRICFEGSAEVDINEHRPSDWPEHTVLEMIDATFQEKMDLTEQLAMICKTCLGNFMQIYAFSTKLKMANQQLLQLYIQAQGGEMYVVHEGDTIEEGCSLLEQEPETETIEQADALDFEPIDEGADMIDESPDVIDECPQIMDESPELIDECPEIMEEFQSVDSEDGVAKPSQKLANLDSLIVSEFLPVTTSKPLAEGTSESPLQLQQWTVDYAAVELKHNDLDDYNETNRRLHVEPSGSQAIYKCKYCPQAFASSQYLKTHVRKSHVCKYCTCAFAKFKDLNDHIRNKHPNHPCVVCTNTFSTSRYLRAHLKRVHGVHLPAQVALLDYRPASRKQYNPD